MLPGAVSLLATVANFGLPSRGSASRGSMTEGTGIRTMEDAHLGRDGVEAGFEDDARQHHFAALPLFPSTKAHLLQSRSNPKLRPRAQNRVGLRR